MGMSNSFADALATGDIVFSLAVAQSAGGGTYYLRPQKPQLYSLLEPPVAKQEYIEKFLPWKGQSVTHDFTNFRRGGIPWGVPLGELHARWVKVPTNFSQPWLKAEPSSKSVGKIVVSKTVRYGNQFFPWKDLVQALGHKMIFVGLETEWKSFCSRYGKYVEYARTKDMLEVAQLIAGASLFIGNQSSPNSICEGLKQNLVQEVSLTVPDCIYPRDNAVHCFDGNLEFEFEGHLHSFEPVMPKVRMSKHD